MRETVSRLPAEDAASQTPGVVPPLARASAARIDRAAARLTTALAALVPAREGDLPVLAALRASGRAAFVAQGAPGLRTEAWRYSPLRGLERRLEAPPAPIAAPAVDALQTGREVRLEDGVPASLPSAGAVAAGVRVWRLAEAPADLLAHRLGQIAVAAQRPFVALNQAALGDGLVVHVAAGTDAGAISLRHLAPTAGVATAHAGVRVLVVVEEGASLVLTEEWQGSAAALTTAVVELSLGTGARVRHLRLQRLDAERTLIATTAVRLERDSFYDQFALTTGAGFSRHDIDLALAGPGAEARANGLTLLRGRQHSDTASFIQHQVPNTRSDQTYRTVLDEHARGVFQGKIRVHEGAQKTDGYQMNRALLLSALAEMNSKPELEIYADDVRCSHGATTGQLDPAQLFYLRARGLPEVEARALLVAGFMAESLAQITDLGQRERAAAEVAVWAGRPPEELLEAAAGTSDGADLGAEDQP